MERSDMTLEIKDNGGTRTGTDRRKFRYSAYIPEKRSGRDRRREFDRRNQIARRRESERRVSLNHQGEYPIERRDVVRTHS